MKTVTVKCAYCGNDFEKPKGEVTRSNKLGRRHYCSLSCCGKDNNKHFIHDINSAKHLQSIDRRDKYSPFRSQLRIAKMHSLNRPKEFAITLENLKKQWDKQQGVCPYTGWELDLPPFSGSKTTKHPARASLDRIDSSQGYVPDNIQFVALMANLAKNAFSEQQLIEFCKAVAIMKSI